MRQYIAKPSADQIEIDRHFAGKIRNTKPATDVDERRHDTDLVCKSPGEGNRRCLCFCNRFAVERLAARKDMKAPPVRVGFDQTFDERYDMFGINAECCRAAAHFHARTLERKIGVYANSQFGRDSQPVGDGQGARRLTV